MKIFILKEENISVRYKKGLFSLREIFPIDIIWREGGGQISPRHVKIFLQKEENWIFAGPWHQHQRSEGLSIWLWKGKYMKQIWLPIELRCIKFIEQNDKTLQHWESKSFYLFVFLTIKIVRTGQWKAWLVLVGHCAAISMAWYHTTGTTGMVWKSLQSNIMTP